VPGLRYHRGVEQRLPQEPDRLHLSQGRHPQQASPTYPFRSDAPAHRHRALEAYTFNFDYDSKKKDAEGNVVEGMDTLRMSPEKPVKDAFGQASRVSLLPLPSRVLSPVWQSLIFAEAHS
jgi:hypothetical protein